MAEMTQKTQETEVEQKGDTQIVKESVTTDSSAETQFTLANGIWVLLGVLEVGLAFRFALRLFGANPNAAFVNFVYSVSDFFTWPFNSIFSTATTRGDVTTGVFEPSTLVAMAVYALIAWGLIKVVTLNQES